MKDLQDYLADNLQWFLLFIGIVAIATCATAQAPVMNGIGGGCSHAKTGLYTVPPRIGKPWVIKHHFPEPVGTHTVSALGFSNPDIPLFCGRLRTSAELLVYIGPGGSAQINLPNDARLLGLRLYLQAGWVAWHYTPALSDAYYLRIGR